MSGLKETFRCSLPFSGTGVTRNMILRLKFEEYQLQLQAGKGGWMTTSTSGGDIEHYCSRGGSMVLGTFLGIVLGTFLQALATIM